MEKVTARVVLKKARTYNLGGIRWIKNVPKPVHGEEAIKEFEQNGYFHVTRLSSVSKKAKSSEVEKKSTKKKSLLKKG